MSFSGISPGSIILIILIIILFYGTKKLKNIGEEIGQAFKGFRKGLHYKKKTQQKKIKKKENSKK